MAVDLVSPDTWGNPDATGRPWRPSGPTVARRRPPEADRGEGSQGPPAAGRGGPAEEGRGAAGARRI